MIPPRIEQSTKEERRAFVMEAWKCLHDCESCGKCRVLKGKDAETLYADYIDVADEYGSITIDENIKAPADCEIRLRDERTCFTD